MEAASPCAQHGLQFSLILSELNALGYPGRTALWSWAGRVTVVTTPWIGGATNVNGEQPPCCTYQELHCCAEKKNELINLQ